MIMKYKILRDGLLLSLMALICLYQSGYGQQFQAFTIEGNIKDLPENVKVFLTTNKADGRPDTLQTDRINQGKFVLNLKGVTPGKIHFVQIEKSTTDESQNPWFLVITDSPMIKVSGNAAEWTKLKIVGSAATTIYMDYQITNKNYFQKIKELEKQLVKALPESAVYENFNDVLNHSPNDTSALGKEARIIYNEWKGFVKNFFNRHKSSVIMPLLVTKSNALNLDEKQQCYDALSIALKNSLYGKELSAYIDEKKHDPIVRKLQVELVSGKRMPDFRVTDINGKPMSVLDIASKSEYTLIDFWASWCGPCRAAIPKIKEVYEAYRSKGFNVLGISTDKYETDWKKALAQENTKWDNGLDNIDRANKNIFGLVGIPGYVLLDKNGVIVKTDYINAQSVIQVVKEGEKSLCRDLKEIIAELFKGK